MGRWNSHTTCDTKGSESESQTRVSCIAKNGFVEQRSNAPNTTTEQIADPSTVPSRNAAAPTSHGSSKRPGVATKNCGVPNVTMLSSCLSYGLGPHVQTPNVTSTSVLIRRIGTLQAMSFTSTHLWNLGGGRCGHALLKGRLRHSNHQN